MVGRSLARALLASLAIFSLAVGGPAAAVGEGGDHTDPTRRNVTPVALDLFERLNDERAGRGLPALEWSASLTDLATDWSVQLRERGMSPPHRPHADRLAMAPEFSEIGENVGAWVGLHAASTLHQEWMKSDRHRPAMLSAFYQAVGIGVVCDGSQMYATVNFGRYQDAGPGSHGPAQPHQPVVRTDPAEVSCMDDFGPPRWEDPTIEVRPQPSGLAQILVGGGVGSYTGWEVQVDGERVADHPRPGGVAAGTVVGFFVPGLQPGTEHEVSVHLKTGDGQLVEGPSAMATGGDPADRTADAVAAGAASAIVADDSFVPGDAFRVVIARDDQFADALAGAPLTLFEGPLLFATGGTAFSPEVEHALASHRIFGPGCPEAIILGGPNAVAPALESDLEAYGYCPRRVSGPSRIETALLIADEVVKGRNVSRVLLARADDWPDAITGSVIALREQIPILLTGSDGLHPAVRDWLGAHLGVEVVMLGGRSALSDAVEQAVAETHEVRRVSGPSREATAAAIATELGGESSGVVLVNGYDGRAWPHALAASLYTASFRAVQLFSRPDDLPAATQEWLDAQGAGFVSVAGPPEFVSDAVLSQARGR